MTTPEQEKPQAPPPEVHEVPETVPVTQTMAQQGITAPPSQATQPVQPPQSTSTQQPDDSALTLPKSEDELEKDAKGSAEDSRTWWATSVIRMLKKALHFGRKVIGLQSKEK